MLQLLVEIAFLGRHPLLQSDCTKMLSKMFKYYIVTYKYHPGLKDLFLIN